MPIASGVLWCEAGRADEVAERVTHIAGTEVHAREGDAVVVVLEAADRRGVDHAFKDYERIAGVSWVDATYYTEEDLDTLAEAGGDLPIPAQPRG